MAKNLDAKPAKLKVWLRLEEKEKIEALIYFIKKEPDCLDCIMVVSGHENNIKWLIGEEFKYFKSVPARHFNIEKE